MSATYVKLILAAVFWGGTFSAGRIVTQELGPFNASFIRFFLASCLLLPFVLKLERRLPRVTPGQLAGVILLGLTGIFAYNILFFFALRSVEAGRAAVIIAANPVFIALFSFFFFGERFSPHRLLGILLSVSGAMIVVSRGDIGAVLQGQIGRGEIALLGCVFSWVSYTLIGKRVLHGLSPLVAVTYSCMAGTLLLLPLALYTGLPHALETLSLPVLGNLVYLAVFGTVLGFVWFYQGVKEIGPSRAGLFINLVPVSGVALGVLLLEESLSLSLLGGGSLVLAGLFLTNRVR